MTPETLDALFAGAALGIVGLAYLVSRWPVRQLGHAGPAPCPPSTYTARPSPLGVAWRLR